MSTTKQVSITLPADIVDAVHERVASGAYTSESEVVRESLEAFFDRDEAIEEWLRSDVVEAYDELRSDPSQAISSEGMRAYLAELHEQQSAESGS